MEKEVWVYFQQRHKNEEKKTYSWRNSDFCDVKKKKLYNFKIFPHLMCTFQQNKNKQKTNLLWEKKKKQPYTNTSVKTHWFNYSIWYSCIHTCHVLKSLINPD